MTVIDQFLADWQRTPAYLANARYASPSPETFPAHDCPRCKTETYNLVRCDACKVQCCPDCVLIDDCGMTCSTCAPGMEAEAGREIQAMHERRGRILAFLASKAKPSSDVEQHNASSLPMVDKQ